MLPIMLSSDGERESERDLSMIVAHSSQDHLQYGRLNLNPLLKTGGDASASGAHVESHLGSPWFLTRSDPNRNSPGHIGTRQIPFSFAEKRLQIASERGLQSRKDREDLKGVVQSHHCE